MTFGTEGFVDAIARETASFGISFTLAEPGPTRTNFGRCRVEAAPLSACENTPVGLAGKLAALRAQQELAYSVDAE